MFRQFMNTHKMLEIKNLLVIFLSFGIHSTDDRGHVTKNSGVHQGYNLLEGKKIGIDNVNLPPMNIMIMENIFSSLVFPETFPKPMVVNEELVKYKAVV